MRKFNQWTSIAGGPYIPEYPVVKESSASRRYGPGLAGLGSLGSSMLMGLDAESQSRSRARLAYGPYWNWGPVAFEKYGGLGSIGSLQMVWENAKFLGKTTAEMARRVVSGEEEDPEAVSRRDWRAAAFNGTQPPDNPFLYERPPDDL